MPSRRQVFSLFLLSTENAVVVLTFSYTLNNTLLEARHVHSSPEYPRPQFARQDWLCLNGAWQFEIDQGDSGLERGLLTRTLAGRINVPFCPESQLSGVENNDFLEAVCIGGRWRYPANGEDAECYSTFRRSTTTLLFG